MNLATKTLSTFAIATLTVGCGGAPEATTGDDGYVTDSQAAFSSAYTSLEADACEVVEQDESFGTSTSRCDGMGDWEVFVDADGPQETLRLVSGESESSLYIFTLPSTVVWLGPKAEWRGRVIEPGVVEPKALIFRRFESDNETTTGSSLLVVRLDPEVTCIVGHVDTNQPDANVAAREIADHLDEYGCISFG
jgi:hypothetical protein